MQLLQLTTSSASFAVGINGVRETEQCQLLMRCAGAFLDSLVRVVRASTSMAAAVQLKLLLCFSRDLVVAAFGICF